MATAVKWSLDNIRSSVVAKPEIYLNCLNLYEELKYKRVSWNYSPLRQDGLFLIYEEVKTRT